MGTSVGRIGPIAHPGGDTNWLLLDLDNLGDHEVDRCQPFSGLPVVGAFALEGKRPGLWRRTHARIISLPFGYSGGVQRPYVRFQTEQDKIAILKAGSLVRRKNELHLKFLLMKTLGLLTAGCSG